MLALNLGGRSYPWFSAPIIVLFAIALGVGAAFVLRLATAPEPLIPIAILVNPIVRWTSLPTHSAGARSSASTFSCRCIFRA